MKKLTAIMMSVVLAVGCLTGCGTKSDEDILAGAVDSINAAKSYEMEADMTGKMSIEVEDQTQDIDYSTNVKSVCFTNPLKAKTTATSTVLGQTTTTETYMQKDGDNYIVYVNADGNSWTKMELGDLDEAIASSGVESIAEQLSTDASRYTQKDDKTEDGKTYLVYDYTLDEDDIKKMAESMSGTTLKSLLGDEDSEETEQLINKMLENIGDMTMTIYIDRETETLASVEYPMTDMMNNMLNSMMSYFSEQADSSKDSEDNTVDMAEALASVKLQVSDMNMVMTYKNQDSAEDFEIPDAALNAETSSTTSEDVSEDSEE